VHGTNAVIALCVFMCLNCK